MARPTTRSDAERTTRPGPNRTTHEVGKGERGQVAPLLGVALLLVVGAAILLGRLALASNDAARARTAADAAALAGAAGGRGAAEHVATRNGGALIGWGSRGDGAVVVTVTVGDATATAAAERTVACIDAHGATVLC